MTTLTNKWFSLAIISGALLLIGIDMTVLNVALPSLTQQLGATTSDKLWMINAYSLVMAGLLPGFGTLSDRIGPRTIFLWGLAVFGVASLIAAFSPTPAMLIVARGFLAVGAAMMMPASLSLVRLIFTHDQERATAIGIWGAVWGGAGAMGPLLGGVLMQYFWWGSVFLINVPIVVLTIVLAVKFIPNIPGNPRRKWDALSSGMLTVTLIGLLYGIKGLLKSEIHFDEVGMSLAIGIFFGWFYFRRQKSQTEPLVDFTLFRNVRLSIGTIVALVAAFAMHGVQYVLSQELQLVRGLTPLQTGLYVLPMALAAFASGPAAGAFMLRIGIERMLALMLFVAALGLGLFTFTAHGSTMIWELTTFTLIGLGAGGAMAVASAAIMINAPDDKAGMAGSIESISYELGGTLGVAVMGSIMATIYTQSFAIPAATTLPQSALESFEHLLATIGSLPQDIAQAAREIGNNAFLNGSNAALLLGTITLLVLFVAVAAYGWHKNAVPVTIKH